MCLPVYLFSNVILYEWNFTFQLNVLKVYFTLLLDIERLPVSVWVFGILHMASV